MSVKFDPSVHVVLGEFIVKAFPHDTDPLFSVYALLHSNVYSCELAVSVARFVKSMLPNTLHAVDVVQVLFADVEKSTAPILGMS